MLAILGSPYVNGTTAAILDLAIRRAKQAGYIVTLLFFSWIFGQSRGAMCNIDEFFRTADMKPIGKAFVQTQRIKKNCLSRQLKRLEVSKMKLSQKRILLLSCLQKENEAANKPITRSFESVGIGFFFLEI